MGSKPGTTRTKKGVTYSKETNEIVDCLFCRIVREQSPANQLWYQDERCAVFIPRGPAARLHLLVVPIEHVQNAGVLTEEHRSLLEHMKKVALEQLRVHSEHLQRPLLPLASPPSEYGFNRGHLPTLCPTTEPYTDEETPNDRSFDLCFHRPPYNSINHLHLHAIQKPFRTKWSRFMFAERFLFFKTPWHGALEDILKNLSKPKAKL